MPNEVQRNPDGTFPKGVSGNPAGRPLSKKNQITNLKQNLEIAIRENVRPQDIQDIVGEMIQMAKNGSVQAAKLVLDKTVSNAKEAEEQVAEGGGLRIVVENITMGRPTEAIDAQDGEYEEI